MKIVHINSYYGGGMFYKNLYDRQIHSGIDITVYLPTSQSKYFSSLNIGDYTDVSLNHSKYDRTIFHIKHKKIYKDITQKYNFDEVTLTHSHSLFSNGYISMKIKQEFGIPYVVAVRNSDVNTFFKYALHLRKLGVRILLEANKVIFLSESYRDNVIEKYVPNSLKEEIYGKVSIIPNGIDDFWFKNIGIVKKAPNKDSLKLLHVGVVDKNKNIITTVKAVEILQQKGYNIEFTVVGKIKDKRVYNRIKKFKFVNYISPKSRDELIKIYRANNIFVMPSITETFGLVYAEAMSQGLPVIYSRGQGFDKQFEEGKIGYSVSCYDYNEIAQKIIYIVNDYEKLSQASIVLSERFNWDDVSLDYKKIYEDIISKV